MKRGFFLRRAGAAAAAAAVAPAAVSLTGLSTYGPIQYTFDTFEVGAQIGPLEAASGGGIMALPASLHDVISANYLERAFSDRLDAKLSPSFSASALGAAAFDGPRVDVAPPAPRGRPAQSRWKARGRHDGYTSPRPRRTWYEDDW